MKTPEDEPTATGVVATWAEALLAPARRHPVLFVLAIVLALYLPWLEAAPVSGSIEGHRLVAAREMVTTGDWVVPRLNGEVYLAKPPFQYWLIGLLSLPVGNVTLWTARAVSALSVVLLCAVVALWASRELSPSAGIRAGLMVALSGVLLEKGVLAELEAVLAVTTATTLCLLWFSVWTDRRRWGLVVLAGLCLGAAVLTKGPVPLLPFLAAALALVATAGERRRRALANTGLVLALGLLSTTPWFALLLDRVGRDQALEVFGFEVLHRLHSPGVTNREPFWYYGPALLSALFPVTLLLPAVVVPLRREPGVDARRRALRAFLAAWAIGTVLLLSLSGGKEVRYLIATVPAWCFLIAWGLEARPDLSWPRRWARVLGRAATWLWWSLPLPLVVGGWWMGELPAAALAAALVACSALLVPLARGRVPVAFLALALLLAGVKLGWAKGYLAHRSTTNPVMAAGAQMGEWIPAGTPLCVLPKRYSSPIHFAVDRPIVIVRTPEEALDARPGEPAFLLVDSPRALRELGGGWEELGRWRMRSRDYHLLRKGPRK